MKTIKVRKVFYKALKRKILFITEPACDGLWLTNLIQNVARNKSFKLHKGCLSWPGVG